MANWSSWLPTTVTNVTPEAFTFTGMTAAVVAAPVPAWHWSFGPHTQRVPFASTPARLVTEFHEFTVFGPDCAGVGMATMLDWATPQMRYGAPSSEFTHVGAPV